MAAAIGDQAFFSSSSAVFQIYFQSGGKIQFVPRPLDGSKDHKLHHDIIGEHNVYIRCDRENINK